MNQMQAKIRLSKEKIVFQKRNSKLSLQVRDKKLESYNCFTRLLKACSNKVQPVFALAFTNLPSMALRLEASCFAKDWSSVLDGRPSRQAPAHFRHEPAPG